MRIPLLVDDLFQFGDANETPDSEIAEALGRPEEYRNGIFLVRLNGGAIHPINNWIAWIDFYEDKESKGWMKDNYHLRIQVDSKLMLDWEVETYNPYFGAVTMYCHWHDDRLIYIYAEKHDYYGIVATPNEVKTRVNLGVIGSPIHIKGNTVRIIRYEESYNGLIEQYQLPDWIQLDPLPEAKAREMGLLED